MREMLVTASAIALVILLLVAGRLLPTAAVVLRAQGYGKFPNGTSLPVMQLSNASTSTITLNDPELEAAQSGNHTRKLQLHLGKKRELQPGQTYTIPVLQRDADQRYKVTIRYSRPGWKRDCRDFLTRHGLRSRMLRHYLQESTSSAWLMYEPRS
jgi:hypothetical protein